jgi:hypothetical protein
MKPSKLAWLEWLASIFDWHIVRHRTCRLCRRRILKTDKYRHVKVGPFWVDRVEHKDCKNPTLETPWQLAQRMGPELPFDAEIRDQSGIEPGRIQ